LVRVKVFHSEFPATGTKATSRLAHLQLHCTYAFINPRTALYSRSGLRRSTGNKKGTVA